MSLEKFTLRYRNDIVFGIGICEEAFENFVKSKNFKKALIVTGRRSAKISGAFDKIVNVLEKYGIQYEHYSEVSTNPTIRMAEEVSNIAKRSNVDLVIAIGGGSVIDVSKAAALAACSNASVEDLFWGRVDAHCKITLVVVNLTHGSGSEADRYAVLTDEKTCIKRAIVSEYAYPTLSIDDPQLTVTLPKEQTVYTSIDAFYHCLEASSSVYTSPFTRILAETGLKLVVQYLPRAFENGQDLEARYWLMYAALLGGICIDNSRTHIVHAVEHAVSGLRPDIAHGLGLAVLGPKLISYLYSKCPENFKSLKVLIPDLKLRPEEHRRVEHYLSSLVRQYGIECSLSYLKLGKDDIPNIVKLTFDASRHLIDMAPYKISDIELKNILEELAT